MKLMVLILSNVLIVSTLVAQNDTEVFANIFKNQKKYITDSIAEKEKPKYLALIYFANVIHPKVKDEIKKVNPSFWGNSENMNILEFFPSYTSVKGWIWKSNNLFYSYTFGADKKLILHEHSASQLSDTSALTIIENYSNWNHPLFTTRGHALSSPTDRPFYLTSKNITGAIQTIGFYYQ